MLKIVFENYYIIQIFTLCINLKKKLVKTNVILEKLWSFRKRFCLKSFCNNVGLYCFRGHLMS